MTFSNLVLLWLFFNLNICSFFYPYNTQIFFQKQVKESDYGTDIQTIKAEYERHQKEHKVIDQFQGNVEKCREAEVRFHGEELKIYGERMTILQKAYNELLVLSNKRVSDLHTLHDFITAAHSGMVFCSFFARFLVKYFIIFKKLVPCTFVISLFFQILEHYVLEVFF